MGPVTKQAVSQSQGSRQLLLHILQRAKDLLERSEFVRSQRPLVSSKTNPVRLVERIRELFINKKKFSRFQFAT